MNFRKKVKEIIPNRYHYILDEIYFASLPLQAILYQGNQVTCPCCGSCFCKFLSTKPGRKVLRSEKCPKCDSWKRHRAIWLYLQNKTNLFSEQHKVLHIAPEYSLQKNLKNRQNLEYISADLSSSLAMVKIDITDIPYEDNSFSVILCSHVLEHIEDDLKAMKELLRILEPSGWAILQVPIDRNRQKTFEDPTVVSPQERERLFWQHDHVRLYGLDYKNRLKEAGFTVKVDSYLQQLEKDSVEKYGLKKEDIYFCTKPIDAT